MKNGTEELILSEIILLKTEVLRTNGKLDDMKNDMNRRFDAVNEKFEDVDKRFDGIDGKLEKIEYRLDIVEEKLDWTMESSGKIIDTHEKRITVLETSA